MSCYNIHFPLNCSLMHVEESTIGILLSRLISRGVLSIPHVTSLKAKLKVCDCMLQTHKIKELFILVLTLLSQ